VNDKTDTTQIMWIFGEGCIGKTGCLRPELLAAAVVHFTSDHPNPTRSCIPDTDAKEKDTP
jgi:hypothetical protein